ncbi:glycosyltransferase [Pseudodonghicola flavimaris]|uniref:Glycosyltransferase n=1 Tax=Pseudodonghicola flavimaris TaxID=3050036 RepID=A0ABT7F6B0_9RHOB|nr:glycosyltransferase [Pseudodonghicola flavimaris]MDK3020146.1 glycosyltransferase [Pseudodonghicola flavimaris]
MLRIAHLIDDTNPGGVTRYLDFIARDPDMAELAEHRIVPVPRNRPTAVPVEADIVVSHLTISWRGLPGLMLLRARHSGQPLIHVEHSYSAGFAAANVTAPGRFRRLLRCAYALFDRVVAVSQAQAGWLAQRELVAAGALTVIPPCVDLSVFRAMKAPSGPVRSIGAIGRFDRQKGFDLLIRAFRALPDPDLRLRLIGDGPERVVLEALADEDPRIHFTGFTADPAAELSRCDAIAMPSRWEPYGLVAQEARAARRPVLCSAVDGLGDAGRGLSPVADGSISAWISALVHLTGADHALLPATDGLPAELHTLAGWHGLLAQLAPNTAGARPADVAVRSA